MFYVGLDIHSNRIAVCALSETGQVAHTGTQVASRGPTWRSATPPV
jgi:hypothetical protein